ncbi:DUF3291 domain-containing protein [Robertkochia sediminum]|uniref:DUF3291 domain-containing protein n=1 Tax=Robertkochia sediminum TaxID=2785326 RepID=UPI0019339DA1|nr:DUF3291 domain-containing protein [Robertkochia sediminum]MBL7472525.1 DUF3291 domain-containing protein [Robertkochia sediminum]
MAQITTLTVFRYNDTRGKLWAFWMMQFAHRHLKNVNGCSFYKLMGSGKEGFDPRPDWSTYALLQVWESERDAAKFFETSALVTRYRKRSAEMGTFFLKGLKAHGAWSGGNPFQVHPDPDPSNQKVLVITRATIKKRFLRRFWNYVPTSQRPLRNAEGLLYTKGIGEWPVIQMATVSLWESEAHLKRFAYESEEHRKAIMHTRTLGWYKEELFSRFQPYRFEGSLSGNTFSF